MLHFAILLWADRKECFQTRSIFRYENRWAESPEKTEFRGRYGFPKTGIFCFYLVVDIEERQYKLPCSLAAWATATSPWQTTWGFLFCQDHFCENLSKKNNNKNFKNAKTNLPFNILSTLFKFLYSNTWYINQSVNLSVELRQLTCVH